MNITNIWLSIFLFEIILFSSYTILMYKYSKKEIIPIKNTKQYSVTLIIPMHNEENVIKDKILNTEKLLYNKDNFNVIVIDDYSTDSSLTITGNIIENSTLNIKLCKNLAYRGKANALNWIIPQLNSDITIISDADALLKDDAIFNIIGHFDNPTVGGVTGKIVIVSDKEQMSKAQEQSYRFFFDIWRQGESNLHSVSVCNGPLMAFRTNILQKIKINPNLYSDDSDILFKVIQQGFRVLYEPKAIVYERVPQSIKGRLIQKLNRIKGLKQVYFNNLNLLGKGTFGKIIYPYALLTHIFSPILVLILVSIYPIIILYNQWYLLLPLMVLMPKIGQTIISFVLTQFIMNFTFLIKNTGSWEHITDARYELNTEDTHD